MIFLRFFRLLVSKFGSPCSFAFKIRWYIRFILFIHGRKSGYKFCTVHSTDTDKIVFWKILVMYQQNAFLSMFLLHLPVKLKLLHCPLNACNQFWSCLSDCIKGRFQLFHIPTAAPACDISKGIIGCIYTEMLAHCKSHTLRFHFLCIPVLYRNIHALINFFIMQSHLMHHCFQSLAFAHIFLNSNPFFCCTEIPFGIAGNIFKCNRNRRNIHKRLDKILISLHRR